MSNGPYMSGALNPNPAGKVKVTLPMPTGECPSCYEPGFTGYCTACGYSNMGLSSSEPPSRESTVSFAPPPSRGKKVPRANLEPGPRRPPTAYVLNTQAPVPPSSDAEGMTEIDLESQPGSEGGRRSCWIRFKYNVSHQRGQIAVGCIVVITVIVISVVLHFKYGHEQVGPTANSGTSGKWVMPGAWNGTA